MGIAADSSLGAQGVAARSRTHTRFYVALGAFMVAIVVAGFWPSYFGPLLRGHIERPAVIQAHGLIFVGWMALLIAQCCSRRVARSSGIGGSGVTASSTGGWFS